MPRIPAGRFFAVLLALGGRLVLFVPAAEAGCRIGPRHPIEAATEAVTECAPLPGCKTGTAPRRATLCPDLDAAASGGVMPQGFPVSLSGTGSGGAGHVPVVDWRYTCHVPAVYLRR